MMLKKAITCTVPVFTIVSAAPIMYINSYVIMPPKKLQFLL